MKNISFLCLFLLLTPFYLVAQNPVKEKVPELNSDRPDRGQSPVVVPRGTFQLETGFEFQKDRNSSSDRRDYIYPNMLLRVGLFSRAELRVNFDYKKSLEKKFAGPLSLESEEDKGFNDVRIGTKINLFKGKGLLPEMGVLARVTLPIGEKDFRPPHIAPGGILLFSHELSEKVELEYNIGYQKQREQGEYQVQTIYALNTSVELTDRVKVFVELFGNKPRHDKAQHQLDTGLIILLLPNLQIDIIGGVGLHEAAPNYFTGGGLTWRLPR